MLQVSKPTEWIVSIGGAYRLLRVREIESTNNFVVKGLGKKNQNIGKVVARARQQSFSKRRGFKSEPRNAEDEARSNDTRYSDNVSVLAVKSPLWNILDLFLGVSNDHLKSQQTWPSLSKYEKEFLDDALKLSFLGHAN